MFPFKSGEVQEISFLPPTHPNKGEGGVRDVPPLFAWDVPGLSLCHAEVSNTIRTPHASFEEKKRASTLLLLDAVTFVIFNFFLFP